MLVKRGTFIDIPCLINEETIKNYLALEITLHQKISLIINESDPGLCQILAQHIRSDFLEYVLFG